MATLKDIAASQHIVTEVALTKVLSELKTYIDGKSSAQSAELAALTSKLNTLIGTGDTDKVINTFNEIKSFLADYDSDDTLKSLIGAVETAVSTEKTRAEAAEKGLADRITTLEGISVLTETEAKTQFDNVFNPS